MNHTAEIDALIGIYAENERQIKALMELQRETLDELAALARDAPSGD
jgi:hypothetical protein